MSESLIEKGLLEWERKDRGGLVRTPFVNKLYLLVRRISNGEDCQMFIHFEDDRPNPGIHLNFYWNLEETRAPWELCDALLDNPDTPPFAFFDRILDCLSEREATRVQSYLREFAG